MSCLMEREFFSMPAAFTHFLNGCCAIERRKPLKISPSPRSPQYFRASSLIGNVASVSVFSVHRRMQWPPSGLRSILSHRSCNRSLRRNPVNRPNIDACLRIGTSHSGSIKDFHLVERQILLLYLLPFDAFKKVVDVLGDIFFLICHFQQTAEC